MNFRFFLEEIFLKVLLNSDFTVMGRTNVTEIHPTAGLRRL